MAVDSKRIETLRTYGDVMNFLLQTYATNQVIAEAYSDVLDFHQNSALTKETSSRISMNKNLRSGLISSDRRLQSLPIDRLLPRTRAQTRQFNSSNPVLGYYTVARLDHALDDTVRAAKRPAMMAHTIRNNKEPRFRPKTKKLSTETFECGGRKRPW